MHARVKRVLMVIVLLALFFQSRDKSVSIERVFHFELPPWSRRECTRSLPALRANTTARAE